MDEGGGGATTSPAPGNKREMTHQEANEDEYALHGGTPWRQLSPGGFIAGTVTASVSVASGWKPEGRRRFTGSVHDSRVPKGRCPEAAGQSDFIKEYAWGYWRLNKAEIFIEFLCFFIDSVHHDSFDAYLFSKI